MNRALRSHYQDLVDVIGVGLAERLSIDCAGNYYYLGTVVDRDPSQMLDVVRSIGLSATKTLIHQYPLPYLEVSGVGKRQARNRMIRRLSCWYSSVELAGKFGLTRRQINYILRPNQGALG
jgi:hypothetical protein